MAIRMQQRRGTAEQWTTANPVLGPGEIGFEIDTNSFKIGDGVSTWDQLDYFENSVSIAGSIDDYVPLTQKGSANGVATLDSSGQIPGSQLAYVDQAVQNVIGLAPEDLDTLAELAEAIGDDPGFFTTIQQSVEDAVTEAKDYTDGLLVDYARGDGAVFTGAVVLSGEPVQALEAATKSYVDGVAAGLHIHESVVAATTENVNLSSSLENGDVLDGVTLATGNRVLVKNQTTESENGIYVVQASGAAVRATDYDSPAEIDAGDFVFVSGGTVNGDTGWTQTATVGTIGTDPVSFTQFSGAGTYIAGLGITLTGNEFSADLNVVASQTYVDDAITATQTYSTNYTDDEISALSDTLTQADTALQGSIQTLDQAVQDLSSSTSAEFSSIDGEISGLSTTLQQTGTDLLALSADVDTISTDLQAAQSDITAIQGDVTGLSSDVATKAPSESPSFTGTVSLPSTTSIGDVSSSEIGHLNGVTSAIQDQLDAKLDSGVASGTYAPLNDPTFGGTVSLPSTTSIGDVSSTEIGYVNGVTSAIQTQLDSKAPSADPTFTGTVSGVTKAHVGLGNVDNTSDADKPVSTATQTALDAKLSLTGGTMTGKITLDGDPSQALHAVTKQYVDNVEAGLKAKPSVVAATTANLTATYSNGTNGVGATLTATSNGAFPQIDGVSVTTVNGQRGVLVKNQTNAAENGRYNLTTQGDENTPWVLTRCGLCDEASEIPGAYIFVTGGAINGQTGWVQHVDDPATFEVGSDDIDVFQFAGAGSVTAGPNISVSGSQISVVSNPTFDNVITAISGVAFSDGTQTRVGVPSITEISQKTDSYTLGSLAERDTIIEISKASATTLTIPADADLNFPVGTTLDIIQTGSGQVTVAGANGVTVNATPGLKLRTQWSSATLLKRAANTWLVYGDLSA